MTNATNPRVGIGWAFASLGLLIGLLTGMTASSVVAPLIGLMFAFVGGSIITLLTKFDERQAILAFRAIFSLSAACIIGLIAGIVLSEHQLLSPKGVTQARPITGPKYLKDVVLPQANAINLQQRQGLIDAKEAYRQLHELLTKQANEPTGQ